MTHSSLRRRGPLLAALALGLGLSGCSLPLDRPTSSPTPDASDETANLVADASPGDGSTSAPTSGTTYDLRFVSPTASACNVTWAPGAVLPEDYEWCADDDGAPVAGVRIGSCEVVTHRNEMYAVPGGRIAVAAGQLHLDPQFTALLTSCKRRPALHR